MARRLYRIREERIVSGVCGGLGQYFNVDPVLVRVVFVLLALANGIGILAYIILLIIVPLEGSAATKTEHVVRENIKEATDTAASLGERLRNSLRPEHKEGEQPPRTGDRNRYLAGIILVIVGVLILLSNFNLLRWFAWGKLWPLVLVAIGLVIIIAGSTQRSRHD